MTITRRDLIGLAGGAVAGVALSPVPWKLLDDTAIWTQNWPWIPTPVRGVVSEKPGLCTLCGAGCGLKARACGEHVFGLAPVATNPAGGGALCPVVYGAHQLPFHLRRIRQGILRGRDVSNDDAIKAVAALLSDARARNADWAILDERPGRLQSAMYAQFASAAGGRVVTLAHIEDRPLRAAEKLAGRPAGTFGYDFENARVILSVGTPLLDGWGAAARLPRLWAERTAGTPRFLHVGSFWSRTAQLADQAFMIRAGSEQTLITALAGRCDAAKAAQATGLSPREIADLGAELRDRGPAIVVGGGELASPFNEPLEQMIAALNFQLGSVGRVGGIVQRSVSPMTPTLPDVIDSVPDRSLAVLIHDAGSAGVVVSGALLRRKLASGGALVRLSAYRPQETQASDITVAATAFLECADDSCGARDARTAAWSYAPALLTAPEGAASPAQFITTLAAHLSVSIDDYESRRAAKAAAIVKARRGHVCSYADGKEGAVTDLDAFQAAMSDGAVWMDDAAPQKLIDADVARVAWNVADAEPARLHAVAIGTRGLMSALPAAPLASKLHRETRLVPVAGEVRVNVQTASELGLRHGDTVRVKAASGEARGRLRVENSVLPGLVELSANGGADDVLTLLTVGVAAPAVEVRRS